MREVYRVCVAGAVLVSSRAETLNKAIASGSQKVNVDVVQQPDYDRDGGWQP